ncbi:MAG TPA: ABC transporter substrate-binding protein [Candidatus Binatia bacterium]
MPIFIAVFVAIFLFQASAHAVDKIRIGFAPGASSTPFPLAQKKGFLKEEGFEAEIIRMSSTVQVAALTAGEADYVTGMSALRGAIQGLPLKVVASYIQGSTQTLIARSDLKSVKELKGRTIVIGTPGGSPDRHARLMLRHFGLEPDKDVKFASGGLTEGRLARLQQGLIDATVVPVPLDLQARKLGLNVLARAYEIFTYPEGGLVTTTKKIREKPDEVKRVIRAGVKASRYIKTNRDGTIQFLMEWQRIDREIATGTYEYLAKAINDEGSVPESGLRLVVEEIKELAKVNRDIPLSEVSDLSILKETQKELGIKGN